MATYATTRDIQRVLGYYGYYTGLIDGDFGPKTLEATKAVLKQYSIPPLGSKYRYGTMALQQLLIDRAGIKSVGVVDGYFGHATSDSLAQFDFMLANGDWPKDWRQDVDPSPVITPTTNWPRSKTADLERFFGKAGGSQCTAGVVTLPYTMKIAWDTRQKVNSFRCHEKVARSLERIYQSIARNYSPEQIAKYGMDLFGGCYNYRTMRGGSSLSKHAWGIAVDMDPARNTLKMTHDRAFFAKPECRAYIEAWQAEGWTGLGPKYDYDWMHFQATCD